MIFIKESQVENESKEDIQKEIDEMNKARLEEYESNRNIHNPFLIAQ